VPIVVLYRRGPAWEDAKPLGDQLGIREHLEYLTGLYHQGVLGKAGPFWTLEEQVAGDLVGLVVHRADDAEQAAALTDEDPAVRRGLMEADVHRWHA
jgi:uncharacterized protein YciI